MYQKGVTTSDLFVHIYSVAYVAKRRAWASIASVSKPHVGHSFKLALRSLENYT